MKAQVSTLAKHVKFETKPVCTWESFFIRILVNTTELKTTSETHVLEKDDTVSIFSFFRGRSRTPALGGEWPSEVKALQ